MWVYHHLALQFVRPFLGENIQSCLQRDEERGRLPRCEVDTASGSRCGEDADDSYPRGRHPEISGGVVVSVRYSCFCLVLDFSRWHRELGACKDYSWGQPPCSMYEKIIRESRDFTKLLLIQKGLLGFAWPFPVSVFIQERAVLAARPTGCQGCEHDGALRAKVRRLRHEEAVQDLLPRGAS